MFISFEGLDFSGKSTQLRLLRQYLENKNRKVKLIREPGGTIISEKIRDLLLDKKNDNMCDETELLLFAASRAQLIKEVIVPNLENGYLVLSDRFHHSSLAYQGYGRGISVEFIENLMEFVVKDAKPDVTFFIDIPVEEINKRKSLSLFERGGADRIELSRDNFYIKVRNGYLKLFDNDDSIVIIDGLKPIEEIHSEIVDKLNEFGI